MERKVAVCGSVVMDLVVRVPRHPHVGETVLGTSFATYTGGKGYNQAVAAARLGARVSLIACVGEDDFAATFFEAFATDGIDAANVRRDPAGTGVAVPIVDDAGANSIVMVPRANSALTAADAVAAAGTIAGAAVLVLQLEVPISTCLAAAEIAGRAGTTVIWNLAPYAPLPGGTLELAGILVVNDAEAGGLLGDTPAGEKGGRLAAAAILDMGPRAVVVTLGAEGAAFADRSGTGYIAAHPVTAIDTVGAGDAFCGALAWATAGGEPLQRAVAFGNAAGALATTIPGAGPSMPRLTAIQTLLEESR